MGDPVTDITPPTITAEPGSSTTEWKLALATLTTSLIGTLSALNVLKLDAGEQTLILTGEGALVTLIVVGYTFARAIRKKGTQG